MAKKSSLNIPKNIADKIPYQRCYEEYGIIETENGIFHVHMKSVVQQSRCRYTIIFNWYEIVWSLY